MSIFTADKPWNTDLQKGLRHDVLVFLVLSLALASINVLAGGVDSFWLHPPNPDMTRPF